MLRSKRNAVLTTMFFSLSFAYSGCATTGSNFYMVTCADETFFITPLRQGGAIIESNGEEFVATTSPKVVTNFIDAAASFEFDDGGRLWMIQSSSLAIFVPDRDVALIDLGDPQTKSPCLLMAGTS